MSFNRLAYDSGESKKKVQESIFPGQYQMNTPVLCNTCFQENPQIISQHGAVSMPKDAEWRFYQGPIDVESDLFNINRPYTRSPEGKYVPEGKGPVMAHLPDCRFPVQNTRLDNPTCTLRGTGWNRFDPLCMDPQANIFFPGQKMTDTRAMFRDKHRPCVPTPKVNAMDPESA